MINQAWSPMFELVNIFDVFLPQLLLYPNPKDPLNGDAGQKYLNDENKYKEIVRDYVRRFASDVYLRTNYSTLFKNNSAAPVLKGQIEEVKSEGPGGNRRKEKAEYKKKLI